MKILYLSTQYPGFGGAATEAYETIRRLRNRGIDAQGVFIDHCGDCYKAGGFPHPDRADWADPDRIGGIVGLKVCEQERLSNLIVGKKRRRTAWDAVIGKNYLAAYWAGMAHCPSIYITSGIDYISLTGREAVATKESPPAGGWDLKAMRSAKAVIVHSTLDYQLIHNLFPQDVLPKIYKNVVYTPNIAVRDSAKGHSRPYAEREFDICMSASNWQRTMKNFGLMKFICENLPGKKIAICGLNYFSKNGKVCGLGLLSHEEMIRTLGNSRVVVIPSLYDPSPNLYAEAVAAGCNVVINRNVGNAVDHPPFLISESIDPDEFMKPVQKALKLESQLEYETFTAEDALDQLIEAIETLTGKKSGCLSGSYKKAKPVEPVKLKPEPPKGEVMALRCPKDYSSLTEKDGKYHCSFCNADYPVMDGVAVFVDGDKHAGSFSEQWNKHPFTQIDSKGYVSGYPNGKNSHETFFNKTCLTPAELSGKVVLDAGCGPGRFSEIAAKFSSQTVSVDISEAVFHCADLLTKQNKNGIFIKGDLQEIPLEDNYADVAFSVGVIHHTPEPLKALKEIRRVLKPSGVFGVWVYAKQPSYLTRGRAAMREFTSDPRNHEFIWRLAQLAPMMRDVTISKDPYTMLHQIMGISTSANNQEAIQDTFDWLTPRYQYQYTYEEFQQLLVEAGFKNIQRNPIAISFRCSKG